MMAGRVLQVNISAGGVPKLPISQGRLSALGLEGDGHAHPRFHGGPQQAVLVLTVEVIRELAALGYPVFPGALGENLTVTGLDHRLFRIGQRWRIGVASLCFTKIRVPCSTLDVYGSPIKKELYDARVKAGEAGSPRWARGGMYASVMEGGAIGPGDSMTLACD